LYTGDADTARRIYRGSRIPSSFPWGLGAKAALGIGYSVNGLNLTIKSGLVSGTEDFAKFIEYGTRPVDPERFVAQARKRRLTKTSLIRSKSGKNYYFSGAPGQNMQVVRSKGKPYLIIPVRLDKDEATRANLDSFNLPLRIAKTIEDLPVGPFRAGYRNDSSQPLGPTRPDDDPNKIFDDVAALQEMSSRLDNLEEQVLTGLSKSGKRRANAAAEARARKRLQPEIDRLREKINDESQRLGFQRFSTKLAVIPNDPTNAMTTSEMRYGLSAALAATNELQRKLDYIDQRLTLNIQRYRRDYDPSLPRRFDPEYREAPNETPLARQERESRYYRDIEVLLDDGAEAAGRYSQGAIARRVSTFITDRDALIAKLRKSEESVTAQRNTLNEREYGAALASAFGATQSGFAGAVKRIQQPSGGQGYFQFLTLSPASGQIVRRPGPIPAYPVMSQVQRFLDTRITAMVRNASQ
jgi:hypothetical protein